LLNVGFFQDANPGQGTCPGQVIRPSPHAAICKEIPKCGAGLPMRALEHAQGAAAITVVSCWA